MATTPTSLAIKRVLNDIKDLNRDSLEKEGIYHHYNESNVMEANVMMIGPEDTPYENGFYFFQFTFPPNYPFEPPKVKYCTLDGNTRFNPNLYTCGKVCLSIINTWDGPKWTSCQTIRSVLISLRGLVLGVKYPLQNEPGFERATDTRAISYNDVVLYENYRVAIVKMIRNTPSGFEVFKQPMIDHLKQKYSWFKQRLTELSKYDNTKVVSPVYNMCVNRNFSKILKEVTQILKENGFEFEVQKNLLITEEDYSDDEDDPETIRKKKLAKIQQEAMEKAKAAAAEAEEAKDKAIVVKDIKEADNESADDEKKKPTRKAPSNSAKYFDDGYEMVSDNDSRTYVVKTVGSSEKPFKRWVLKK
jgi:ubiquitin-protein ligase